MKIFRRNAIIITVILFVCVAVYLNWSYNRKENTSGRSDAAMDAAAKNNADDSASALFFDENGTAVDANNANGADAASNATGKSDPASANNGAAEETLGVNSGSVSDYFANARLTRKQARDNAINTLNQASKVENASQEAIDQTLASITVMANYEVSEAEIEALITAKGFKECVVFLNDNSAIVAVPAPSSGLSKSDVARITDIVLSETKLTTEQIKIIEVK